MTSGRTTIVYLVSTLRRTGPTMQLLNLSRHLDRVRFEPVVVTLSPEPPDSMRGEFDAAAVPVCSLGLSRFRAIRVRNWRERIGQVAGIDTAGRCLVHSQGVRADAISARALGGLMRVATARNDPYDDYVMKYGTLLGRAMARVQLRALAALPAVVACSATLAGSLRAHGVQAEVIRNGVDTSRFRAASPAERPALRARLGLAPDAHIGVCVGSLAPRKNPLAVVRALRAIDAPGLSMVFIGKGELEAATRREAQGDARIRFAGHVDDVLPYLQASDFIVSSSRSEGLPNSVLEAMACGLPSVLSDIAPHAELLALAPKSGRLFRLDDAAGFASAIQWAASPAGRDAGLTLDEARALVGAEVTTRRYEALYARLAEAPR